MSIFSLKHSLKINGLILFDRLIILFVTILCVICNCSFCCRLYSDEKFISFHLLLEIFTVLDEIVYINMLGLINLIHIFLE